MSTTVTYYPASDYSIGLNTVSPSGAHYSAIDESSQSDADYVGQTGIGTTQDLYTLKDGSGNAPAIPAGSTINTVTVNFAGRVGGPNSGVCSYAPLLFDGTNYATQTASTGTDWTARTFQPGNAPDGGAWTAAKVNALYIGAKCIGGAKASYGEVSWLNVTVVYDAPVSSGGGGGVLLLLFGEVKRWLQRARWPWRMPLPSPA